jgi:mRNA interferase RelE/StbE
VNEGRGWRVDVTRTARHDLKRLDPPVQRKIVAALDGLESDPPTGDVRKLTNRTPPQWRLRVGDWRVLFRRDEEHRTVFVQHVLPRGRAYRD